MSGELVWVRVPGGITGRRVAYLRPPQPWECLVCGEVSEIGLVLEPNGIFCDRCGVVRPGRAAKGDQP